MSHFTVMVVGDNPEDQLMPFCETPSDEYLEFVDKTEEVREEYLTQTEHQGVDAPERPVRELYPSVEAFAQEYHGYEVRDDGLIGYSTNPEGRWDWYQIGGRWSGLLKAKEDTPWVEMGTGDRSWTNEDSDMPPGRCDQIRKKYLDVSGMKAEAAEGAHATYDQLEKATEGIDPPTKTWDQMRESLESINEARELHNAHPWVAAVRKANLAPFMEDPVKYYHVLDGGREAFVKEAVKEAFSTFAILINGKWYERGSMGWFGACGNEKADWVDEFWDIFNTIEDDELITIVDCHV